MSQEINVVPLPAPGLPRSAPDPDTATAAQLAGSPLARNKQMRHRSLWSNAWRRN